MIYTAKIQRAINLAIASHHGQFRKGKDVPYIIHPLTVGLILAKTGAPEDIIIAGILHDTIEDCDVTKKQLQEMFGEHVSEMVNDVTEQDSRLSWEERKQLALEHIRVMKKDSLLIKSADVLHNMTDMFHDYQEEGEKIFERFSATKEMQLRKYTNLIAELKKAWSKNPLMKELEALFKVIQKDWK